MHQSSLNARQTQIDPDGKARFVLSLKDPGVPNWIDPAGVRRGIAAWRWVGADFIPQSKVRKSSLSGVRDLLHVDTPQVTAAERAAVIAKRRAGIRRLYGI